MINTAERYHPGDVFNSLKEANDEDSGDEFPSWWTHASDDPDNSGTYGTDLAYPLAENSVQAPWLARVWFNFKSIIGDAVDPCAGWDPDLPEDADPIGCLRARQYRQVMRALEREIRAEHEHWYFTRDHNIETFTNVSQCFLPDDHPQFRPCPPRPLILDGWWFSALVTVGTTSGETIWQTSLHKQYKHFGVSVAVVGPYLNWVELAEMMPDVYRMVLAMDTEIVSCVTDPRCVAKEHYVVPDGSPDLSVDVPEDERGVIPIWAIQSQTYWGCPPREVAGYLDSEHWWQPGRDGEWSYHPLGHEWIATPWALPAGHVHLPYSIEEFCLPQNYTPHDAREDKVLILAKRSAYFYSVHKSPISFWTQLSKDPAFELVSTADPEDGSPLPEGLNSIGGQSREDYEALVGSAKVLLGIGNPVISPSIYTALCQGTPVVLPIWRKDHKVGGWYDFERWSQHSPAILIGEPYVYGYDAQNYTDLEMMVHRALNTPIERYILPDMRWTYCLQEMKKYLNRDLQAMFRRVVRENGGKIPRLYKGARERTRELDRLAPELESGRKPSTPYTVKIARTAIRAK